MRTSIVFSAALIALGTSIAAAQTNTPSTTNPFTTKPTSSSTTMPNGQPKYQPPPAARSGEKGLSFGQGSASGEIQVKRKP